MLADWADLEDRDVAERDPDTIKQDIDEARNQLASTVDSLAQRANPRRLADDIKVRVIEFVKKPVVTASLVGFGALTVIIVVRRVRNRCRDGVGSRLAGAGPNADVHRKVIGPRLSGDHVVDVDVATLEFARRRVDQPVLLALFLDGLRVEDHHAHVAGLEPTPLL